MKIKIILGLVVLLVTIQFYQPDKNQSTAILDTDYIKSQNPPAEITTLLKGACYDCHSNNTKGYLWYSDISPISWWLASHINEGKEHLNFSKWTTYKSEKQNHKLEECIKAIESGEMPLKPYPSTHEEANLSEGQKKTLTNWFKGQITN